MPCTTSTSSSIRRRRARPSRSRPCRAARTSRSRRSPSVREVQGGNVGRCRGRARPLRAIEHGAPRGRLARAHGQAWPEARAPGVGGELVTGRLRRRTDGGHRNRRALITRATDRPGPRGRLLPELDLGGSRALGSRSWWRDARRLHCRCPNGGSTTCTSTRTPTTSVPRAPTVDALEPRRSFDTLLAGALT